MPSTLSRVRGVHASLVLALLAPWAFAAPAAGQQTRRLTAARVAAGRAIVLDGDMSDEGWQRAEVATDFVQAEPREGAPATNATRIRVVYDETTIYIGIECEQRDAPRVTTSLARDFPFEDNDTLGIILDPFNDDRNGFNFTITPDGAMRDNEIANDGANPNPNWNAVWDVRAKRSADGWTAEVAIPFKTLRYPDAPGAVWGANFNRRVRSKNEISYWSPVPRRHTLNRVSLAGDLAGIDPAPPGRNLKVTPYGLAKAVRRDGHADPDADVGADLKYSVTTRLTLDLTVNTDFSEVEVDTQQVNLTRFPLYFPEKRPFFLENAELFHFGVRPNEKGGDGQAEEFIGFFSRRIGLSADGQPLPLWGGARLTGRMGRYSLGVLQVSTREQGAQPQNDYTVARVRRNLMRSSDAGVIVMNRHGQRGDDSRMVGGDLNFQFMDRLMITSFLARTSSPGKDGHAGKVFARWADNRIDAFATYIDISKNLDPSMSFVPRRDMRIVRGEFNWKYRPKVPRIRELVPHVSSRHLTNQAGDLRTRRYHTGLWTYFHDGSKFEVFRQHDQEVLDAPFRIHSGVVLPVGNYGYDSWTFQYFHNPSSALSGNLSYQAGEFWSGHIRAAGYRLLARVRPRFSVEARYDRNHVELPQGNFDTDLIGVRVQHSLSTRQFVDLLFQYNSKDDVVGYQARYNLIHRPLSDLFVVFQSDTRAAVRVQALTVKFTRLVDF